MSEAEKLPPGPFFDAIREWNSFADKNRAEFLKTNGYELPEGLIPVSAAFARMWQEALDELGETSRR
jgi:hypothetical protein